MSAERSALLSIPYRCRACGSGMIESEAWAYLNLPVNDSEGPGREFCASCDEEARVWWYEPMLGITAEAAADWGEYREAHGLNSLHEADVELVAEARRQATESARRLAVFLGKIEKWETELGK